MRQAHVLNNLPLMRQARNTESLLLMRQAHSVENLTTDEAGSRRDTVKSTVNEAGSVANNLLLMRQDEAG